MAELKITEIRPDLYSVSKDGMQEAPLSQEAAMTKVEEFLRIKFNGKTWAQWAMENDARFEELETKLATTRAASDLAFRRQQEEIIALRAELSEARMDVAKTDLEARIAARREEHPVDRWRVEPESFNEPVGAGEDDLLDKVGRAVYGALGNLENENVGNAKDWLEGAKRLLDEAQGGELD